MAIPLFLKIAIRYLFGKKSTNAINIITGISVFGIAIGTAALILIMSVFNGFEDLMKKYLDAFNAEIKVIPIEGKFFMPEENLMEKLLALENVGLVSQTVEEVAIFEFDENQEVGIIKGVDQYFSAVTGMDSAVIEGTFFLKDISIDYASFGAGMANKLNISTREMIKPIKVYMLKRNRRGALDNEFKSRNVFPSSVFSLRNEKDQEYVLTDLAFAQELIELRGQISSLEIQLNDYRREKETAQQISNILGSNFKVMNRYQQDESFLKVMNIEKWTAFLILGFTLILIIFNVIGSLWMIVIEKKKDISVLQALGLTVQKVKQIFYLEGLLISVLGFILGFVFAYLFYIGQIKYGFIGVANAFSRTAYPISMQSVDVLIVFALVITLGILASIPASRRAGQITAYIRSE